MNGISIEDVELVDGLDVPTQVAIINKSMQKLFPDFEHISDVCSENWKKGAQGLFGNTDAVVGNFYALIEMYHEGSVTIRMLKCLFGVILSSTFLAGVECGRSLKKEEV